MMEIERLDGIKYCEFCDSLEKDVFTIYSFFLVDRIPICKRCIDKLHFLSNELLKQEAHDSRSR